MTQDAQKLPGVQQDTQPQPRSYTSTYCKTTAQKIKVALSGAGIQYGAQRVFEGSKTLHEIFIECEAQRACDELSSAFGEIFRVRAVTSVGGAA